MKKFLEIIFKKLIEAETMDVSPQLVINNPTKNFYDLKNIKQ